MTTTEIDLGSAEMKFINHRLEGGKNKEVGTTYLVGRYLVMECENEMDAFEAYQWFRDSEKAALAAAEEDGIT